MCRAFVAEAASAGAVPDPAVRLRVLPGPPDYASLACYRGGDSRQAGIPRAARVGPAPRRPQPPACGSALPAAALVEQSLCRVLRSQPPGTLALPARTRPGIGRHIPGAGRVACGHAHV